MMKTEMHNLTNIVSKLKLESNNGFYVGLCPFHDEKTPSFIVNPDLYTFQCLSCNASGHIDELPLEKNNG